MVSPDKYLMFTDAGALPYLCYLRSSSLQVSAVRCATAYRIGGTLRFPSIYFRYVNNVDGLGPEISSLFNTLALRHGLYIGMFRQSQNLELTMDP
jgi:hypothetical protein